MRIVLEVASSPNILGMDRLRTMGSWRFQQDEPAGIAQGCPRYKSMMYMSCDSPESTSPNLSMRIPSLSWLAGCLPAPRQLLKQTVTWRWAVRLVGWQLLGWDASTAVGKNDEAHQFQRHQPGSTIHYHVARWYLTQVGMPILTLSLSLCFLIVILIDSMWSLKGHGLPKMILVSRWL